MLYTEAIIVYAKSQTKYTNKLQRQKAKFFNIKSSGEPYARLMFWFVATKNLFCVFLRRGLYFPRVLWHDSLRYFSERGGRRGLCLLGQVAV